MEPGEGEKELSEGDFWAKFMARDHEYKNALKLSGRKRDALIGSTLPSLRGAFKSIPPTTEELKRLTGFAGLVVNGEEFILQGGYVIWGRAGDILHDDVVIAICVSNPQLNQMREGVQGFMNLVPEEFHQALLKEIPKLIFP